MIVYLWKIKSNEILNKENDFLLGLFSHCLLVALYNVQFWGSASTKKEREGLESQLAASQKKFQRNPWDGKEAGEGIYKSINLRSQSTKRKREIQRGKERERERESIPRGEKRNL